MTKIKICGITCLADALDAVAAGAHALGFVFCESPRRVESRTVREIVARLPPSVLTVGVFLDNPLETVESTAIASGVGAVQLHGSESIEECARLHVSASGKRHVIKRFTIESEDDSASIEARMAPFRVSARLLDPGAGSGRAFRWEIARGLPSPMIVAGGLHPDNVAQAVEDARPYAVDVCSGVERTPGRKCPDRLRAFVTAVRAADAAGSRDAN